MSVQSASVSVGSTATALTAAESSGSDPVSVAVAVPSGGVTVYVGGSDVTTGNGYPLAGGAAMSIDLRQGERLYGIVASGTQSVNVLRSGVG